MNFLARLVSFWTAHRPRPLNELLSVEFNETQAFVKVLDRLSSDWNQSLEWSEVSRVCFRDAGLYSSDALFIERKSGGKPFVVLTEARGGPAFFGALSEKGLFPEHVWRKAVGETGGATHCWPLDSNVA